MKEDSVKKALDFLCNEYNFKYSRFDNDDYLNNNFKLQVYCYYNSQGCFAISNFIARGEVEYYRLKYIEDVETILYPKIVSNKTQLLSGREYIENQLKQKICIFDEEPKVWKKAGYILFFPNPFFWWNENKILRVLGNVIQIQIQKFGSFFDIKI
jgi:hypothetical protein